MKIKVLDRASMGADLSFEELDKLGELYTGFYRC